MKDNNKNIHVDEYGNNLHLATFPTIHNEVFNDEPGSKFNLVNVNQDLSRESRRSKNSKRHKRWQNKSKRHQRRRIVISKGVNRLHKHTSNVNEHSQKRVKKVTQ